MLAQPMFFPHRATFAALAYGFLKAVKAQFPLD